MLTHLSWLATSVFASGMWVGGNNCMILYTNACGLYIYMYTFHRAWKRQLYKVVRNQKHQTEIYACLWMLICLSYIKPHLFKTKPLFYHTGKTKSLSLCPITNRNTLRVQVIYTVTCSSTEKWALCYRDFDHHDTDTNMLVERSV